MKRTNLKERHLPNYSIGEEIFNSVSHIVGAFFGVFALITCVIEATKNNNTRDLAGAIVYGVSCLLMFTMSGVYHGSTVIPLKKVFQVVDHCTVYLMVAGSYTPILLSGLYRENKKLAIIMLIIVWSVALFGMALKCYDLTKLQALALLSTVLTGWAVLAILFPLTRAIGSKNVLLIIGGGLSYTIGAILFAIGVKKKYFHCIFHIFVNVGAIVQYIAIIGILK